MTNAINFAQLLQEYGAGSEPIPDGEYDIVVFSAAVKSTRTNPPKHMIVARMRVLSGPYANRVTVNNFVLTQDSPGAMFHWFRNFAILGLGSEYFQANPSLEQIAADIQNRTARVELKTENGRQNVNMLAASATPVTPQPQAPVPGVGMQPQMPTPQLQQPGVPQMGAIPGMPAQPAAPVVGPPGMPGQPAVQQPAPQPVMPQPQPAPAAAPPGMDQQFQSQVQQPVAEPQNVTQTPQYQQMGGPQPQQPMAAPAPMGAVAPQPQPSPADTQAQSQPQQAPDQDLPTPPGMEQQPAQPLPVPGNPPPQVPV